jgi:hypothetical protein
LDSLPDGIEELPLASRSPEPGETVHSVGNSGLADGDVLWRYARGCVRLVYLKSVSTPRGMTKVRLVETQSPVNKGDSGGPVVNDHGRLVGVAASYTAEERLVSENTDVQEVKRFLQEARAGASDGADEIRVAEKSAKPKEHRSRVIGRWKFTVTTRDGEGIAGHGQFRSDATFAVSSAIGKRNDTTLSGRYACANDILLLMHGEATLLLPLTWIGPDRFVFKSGHSEYIFDRQRS